MSENKTRVAVLFGGVSSEHDVSLMSAESVLKNLPEQYEVLRIGITKDGRWVEYTGKNEEITSQRWEEDRSLRTAVVSPDRSHKGILLLGENGWELVKVDICFPVLHGKHGEDGTIQGLFQLAGIPFVGCDAISSANCMDKEMTHTILEANGIKMAKWMVVDESKMENFEEFARQAEEKLGYPMFVKPANAGSSVGVGKAHDRSELLAACQSALKEDYKAVVEECIEEMQEVETAVLGNEHPQAAGVVGELVPVVEFYTYEAKYIDGTTVLHIPGRVSEEISLKLRQTAEKAFRAIGCEGFSRIDFFVRKADGEIILNEINTIPGFTSISMYPKLWAHCGVSYPQLLEKLIELGLKRN